MVFRGGVADLRRTPAPDHRARRRSASSTATCRRTTSRSATCPCCSSRRSPRRASASTCAAAARSPSTCWRRSPDLPRRVRRHRVLRPATSGSSTGSRRPAERDPHRQRGQRRAARAAARLVPGRDHVAARAGRRRRRCRSRRSALVASPFDFRRVRLMSPIRPLANITNGFFGTTLYRAMGGAPAPLVKRALPAHVDRQVPDEADRGGDPPPRPRLARAGRGRRRVHGPDARLPGAHDGPALPPLLPRQRAGRGHARPRRRDRRDPPRRCSRAGAVDRRLGGRARAAAGCPPHHEAAAERSAGAGRDGARRAPRRARRPRRGAQHVGLDRRLLWGYGEAGGAAAFAGRG